MDIGPIYIPFSADDTTYPDTFLAAVAARQDMVSALWEDGVPSATRRMIHQDVRTDAHRAWMDTHPEDRIILGFGRESICERVSLLDDGAVVRWVRGANGWDHPVYTLDTRGIPGHGMPVIGHGPSSLISEFVPVNFDASRDHQWGWKDGMGVHVHAYCAGAFQLVRASMSGATTYVLNVEPAANAGYDRACVQVAGRDIGLPDYWDWEPKSGEYPEEVIS